MFGQYEDGIPIRTFAVQTPAQLCNNGNRYQTLCNMADPCASNGVVVSLIVKIIKFVIKKFIE